MFELGQLWEIFNIFSPYFDPLFSSKLAFLCGSQMLGYQQHYGFPFEKTIYGKPQSRFNKLVENMFRFAYPFDSKIECENIKGFK